MRRTELESYLNQYLDVIRFRDYCPNGLQVEGRAEVQVIVTGVTASLALVHAAVARGADALLVHHGYFWRGEEPRVTGIRRDRLAALLKSELNLFAYHLPLDAHPDVGNNVQLARALDLPYAGTFGEQGLGAHGEFAQPPTLAELGEPHRRTPQSRAASHRRRAEKSCGASPGARARRRVISKTPCAWASMPISRVKSSSKRCISRASRALPTLRRAIMRRSATASRRSATPGRAL